eukprot:EG_transcript_17647
MSVGSKWNVNGAAGKGLTNEECEKAFWDLVSRTVDLQPLSQYDPYLLGEEITLIKFLTARRYNVAEAEKMLRGYIKWRKEYEMSNIFTSPNLQPSCGLMDLGICGHDREGHPLYVDVTKGKDLLHLIKSQPYEVVFRWHVYLLERERQVLQAWGTDQISIIVDLKEITTSCYASSAIMSTLSKISEHDQAMYPEIMRFIFVINAPLAAAAFWKVLAPFLDPVVREKVHIWGPREWRREISKYVAEDSLPARIGGRCTAWYPLRPDADSFVLPPPPPKP